MGEGVSEGGFKSWREITGEEVSEGGGERGMCQGRVGCREGGRPKKGNSTCLTFFFQPQNFR
jgi:hypothetical protein